MLHLVCNYQVHENYGAHDWDGEGDCPQYWKPKGGTEVVASMGEGPVDEQTISRLAGELHPGNDDFYRHELRDTQLVNDDGLEERVLQALRDDPGCEVGYVRHFFDEGEWAFDWGFNKLIAQGRVKKYGPDHGYQSYEIL